MGDTLAFCPTLFQQEPIQTAENSRRGWVPRGTQSGEDSTHVCLWLCGSSFQHLGLPGIPASHTCYRGRAQGRAPLTPGAGPACPSGSLLPPRDGCFHVLTRGRGERHIPGYPTALHHHRDCPQLKRPDWAGVGGCIVSSVITQYPRSPGGIMVKNCQAQEDHTRIFPNPWLSL